MPWGREDCGGEAPDRSGFEERRIRPGTEILDSDQKGGDQGSDTERDVGVEAQAEGETARQGRRELVGSLRDEQSPECG